MDYKNITVYHLDNQIYFKLQLLMGFIQVNR